MSATLAHTRRHYMFDLEEEDKRLRSRYAKLARDLNCYPDEFLTSVADIFFYDYHMIIADVYNNPDAQIWFEDDDRMARADVIDAYYSFRGLLVTRTSEITFFESYRDNNGPTPYTGIYIPSVTDIDAKIVETSVDKRKLRKVTNLLKTYKAEFIKLRDAVKQEQAEIERELKMLQTYAEVAGND